MEISDYIADCMSTESARDFLEMKGDRLSQYTPRLLYTVIPDAKEHPLSYIHSGLEELAEEAVTSGCKYVTGVRVVFDSRNAELTCLGTGLIVTSVNDYKKP